MPWCDMPYSCSDDNKDMPYSPALRHLHFLQDPDASPAGQTIKLLRLLSSVGGDPLQCRRKCHGGPFICLGRAQSMEMPVRGQGMSRMYTYPQHDQRQVKSDRVCCHARQRLLLARKMMLHLERVGQEVHARQTLRGRLESLLRISECCRVHSHEVGHGIADGDVECKYKDSKVAQAILDRRV